MTTILPSSTDTTIHSLQIEEGIIGTTLGLAKTINEDRLGYLRYHNRLRICIADGHWGDNAAEMIIQHWLSEASPFPSTRHEAVADTQHIETQLFTAFGHPLMNPDRDRPPEAAFIAIELDGNQLKIVSYGDCRLLVARQKTITYQLPEHATWLGAFSHMGLRGRTSVETSLVYDSLKIDQDDVIILFTDGVDECVYEVPTLAHETLASIACSYPHKQAFDIIMKDVFMHGAQDNASLAIISTP